MTIFEFQNKLKAGESIPELNDKQNERLHDIYMAMEATKELGHLAVMGEVAKTGSSMKTLDKIDEYRNAIYDALYDTGIRLYFEYELREV